MLQDALNRLQQITASCNDIMHEPDNQGVNAIIYGNHLDNTMGNYRCYLCGELTVGIINDGRVEYFNLATLIALARKANLEE